jgi:hypothetical protein
MEGDERFDVGLSFRTVRRTSANLCQIVALVFVCVLADGRLRHSLNAVGGQAAHPLDLQ